MTVQAPPPHRKAAKTAKWARIMTKWLITYSRRKGARWNVVHFGGKTGAESRGIVDLMAVRKNHRFESERLKRGDLFEIVLIQTKGGSARNPTVDDIDRLRLVAKHHRASAVVLATWHEGKAPTLCRLQGQEWEKVSPRDIFG